MEQLHGKQLLEHMIMLMREIEHAKAQLQPHDTGHINTAISWMQGRVNELKTQIGERLDVARPVGRIDR